jgi:hypothetical protein
MVKTLVFYQQMEALAEAQIAPFLGTVGGTIAVLGVMYCLLLWRHPLELQE